MKTTSQGIALVKMCGWEQICILMQSPELQTDGADDVYLVY